MQALNEEEIFDVQDKRSLYPMGWIHTHPTQTCFLSSIDIHTQCGYQVSRQGTAVVGSPSTNCPDCLATHSFLEGLPQGLPPILVLHIVMVAH